MTYHAMGALPSSSEEEYAGPHDYLTPRDPQQAQLYAAGMDTLGILMGGTSGTVIVPQLGVEEEYRVDVPSHPSVAAIFDAEAPEAASITTAVVQALLIRQQLRQKLGESVQNFNTIIRAIPVEVVRALYNGGNPEGCKRAFARTHSTQLTIPFTASSTGWCSRANVLPLTSAGTVRDCAAEVVCERDGSGNVIEGSPSPAPPVPPRLRAGVPRTITPEEIREQARQERIFEENAATNAAINLMYFEFEIDSSSPTAQSELNAALKARGFTIEEVHDWLTACMYQQGCFYLEFYFQQAEYDRRKERARAGNWVALAVVGAIGIGAMVAFGGRG